VTLTFELSDSETTSYVT